MGWRTKKTKQGDVFETFSWYDVEQAKVRLRPKIEGGQFASANRVADKNQRTTDESGYLVDVNNYIKRLNEYANKKSVEIKKEVSSVIERMEEGHTNFSKLHRFFKEKSSLINDAFIHEEESNQERRLDLRNELNNFRLENNLPKREAYYPKSYILHFAWIFVFIFIEALVNSYFFGEASSLGLLGGVFIGFITSFFNVTFSTMAGYILRYKNHVSWAKKLFGFLGFSILLGAIFFLHLFIAHYRELLSQNPTIEIWSVLKPMLAQPFALHDLESLILISLGLLITLFSIIKGLNLDDSYPAYGGVYRRWKVQEREFLTSKKQVRLLMRELSSVALEKSDGMKLNLIKSKKVLDDLNTDIDAFINAHTSYHIRAVEAARTLIGSYRDGAKFVYGDAVEFTYDDELLCGNGGLSHIDNQVLLESKEIIDTALLNINHQIDEFYINQERLEAKVDEMKEHYLDDANIEKILFQVKKSREVEL